MMARDPQKIRFLTSLSCAAALLTSVACVPEQSAQDPSSEEPHTERNPQRAPPSAAMPAAPEPEAKAPQRSGPAAPMEKNLSQHLAPYYTFGVAMEPHYLEELGPIVSTTFNRMTAENAMKCARIHPSEDKYNYAPADQLADFARKHGMTMTGHALVWYRETPEWLVKGEKKEVLAKLKSHIDTVVARYADVTDNWDVVNEAISDTKDKMYRDGDEGSKLYAALGDDLLKEAFRYAQEAVKKSGKDIDLYYNDYNMAKPEKLGKAIRMAKELKKAGIRIDGIGAQAHWTMTWPPVSEVQKMIDTIVAAGLKVKISELDISIYPKDDWDNEKWEPEKPFTPELAKAQAARYKELFDVFAKNAEHVTSVSVWGLSDDRTWLDDMPAKGRNNHPLLFDDADAPKPAYFALFDVGAEAPPAKK